jgi:hypothetical protein
MSLHELRMLSVMGDDSVVTAPTVICHSLQSVIPKGVSEQALSGSRSRPLLA